MMVLKLLKYVKSAINYFWPNRGHLWKSHDRNGGFLLIGIFYCRFDIPDNSKTILPLGQILIRALFQYFVLRKPTCKVQGTNFFHVLIIFLVPIFCHKEGISTTTINAIMSGWSIMLFTHLEHQHQFIDSVL